jgi:hypothetical protein
LAGIREVKVAEVNYKQAVSEFNDAQRQVDALEAEALKALTGENQLDLGVVNSMLLKQKARLDAAAKKKEEAKVLLEMEKNNKNANEVQVDEILSWASRFDDASGAVPWEEERRKCLTTVRSPQSLFLRALRAFFVFGNMVL